MHQAKVVVHHAVGLHARPAAQFVKLAKQYKSAISVSSKGKTVNAKSMVLLLTLAINKDTEIELTAEGEDEQQAIDALVALIKNNFGE